jgi:hypothetical protein
VDIMGGRMTIGYKQANEIMKKLNEMIPFDEFVINESSLGKSFRICRRVVVEHTDGSILNFRCAVVK